MDVRERFRGSILGLAIGDALGHPTEFLSSIDRIRAKYGPDGIENFEPAGVHKAGTFTDDTQMTIAVARALIRTGGTDVDAFMRVLGQECVAWSRHVDNNRAPGGTCIAGCRHFERGTTWQQAGVVDSKGCGAAMRAAPIGLFFYNDDAALVRFAAAQSVLTHRHPTAIASSVAAAAAVAWVTRGQPLFGLVDYVTRMVGAITPELLAELGQPAGALGQKEQRAALQDLTSVLAQVGGDAHEDVCQLLGGAWVGEEAVSCALWCVLSSDGEFFETIKRGANTSGDSDSIACIAGSVVGALVGYAGVERRFVQRLERSEDLDALATLLWQVQSTQTPVALTPPNVDFFGAQTAATATPKAPAASSAPTDAVRATAAANSDVPAPATTPAPVAVSAKSNVELFGFEPMTVDVDHLEAAVTRHNHLYWEMAAPEISDVAFDTLVRVLQKRKPGAKALLHLGSTPRDKAVTHQTPMLSLDKCYAGSELLAWASDIRGDIIAMPKIDGLACVLHYDAAGQLVLAATRGDGEVGEDITKNARAIAEIPQQLRGADGAVVGNLEVRGEVYMSLAAFAAHAAEKANPRNLAAGALRQKDPNQTRRMKLSFLAYDVRPHDGVVGVSSGDLSTMSARLGLAQRVGFQPITIARARAAAGVQAMVDTMSQARQTLGFETDGVVLIADDTSEHARLGLTAHHPRFAMAWKFQGEEGTSVLRDVEWSVARTGTITPVAIVDPVSLSGVTVTRATLHHVGFVTKLGLTRGAQLAMVRRGGVIPHVERVLAAGDAPIVIPSHCPACGAATQQEGDFLLCSKPADCKSAKIGRLLHYLDAVGVLGLGEAIVQEAMEQRLLEDPADLYTLDVAALARLSRCGDKLSKKIVGEIDKTRTLKLDVFLRSLGIDTLGKTAAGKLAQQFKTLDAVLTATASELAAIKGVGDVMGDAIVLGLRDNADLIARLRQHVKLAGASTTDGPLSGKSFVFTGALSFDRKQAEARVKALGASVPSGVTTDLSYLVVGKNERGQPSSKELAAQKLQAAGAALQILDEPSYLSLVTQFEASAPATTPAPEPEAALVPTEVSATAEPSQARPAKSGAKQLTLF